MSKKNKCDVCGYVGKKIHRDIYDCQDYLDPTWMYDWFVKLKTRSMKTTTKSRFVKWSSKFPAAIVLLN